jgi:alpha-1,6-mannosyltransferase
MRYCDITFAYNEASGGIKTYINQKRKYLREQTDHTHCLIIPGKDDRHEAAGRLHTITVTSPTVPGYEPYRLFHRPHKIRRALQNFSPHYVELGSFLLSPRPAFAYRKKQRHANKQCLVAGYFHTDIAEAYVAGPVRKFFSESLAEKNETAVKRENPVAKLLEQGAETYFGSIFGKCDLLFAAGPDQIERLRSYGVRSVHEIPMGVDTELFSPGKRDPAVRRTFGADEETLILFYAGRLDREKQVELLVEAFVAFKPGFERSMLLLMGEGPLKEVLQRRSKKIQGLGILDYENDRETYAAFLASSDIYVTAGPCETFGLSVIEAQSAGLPVVGVAAGALRERVSEPAGRLGPVGDAAAFAENIEFVARNRASMGEAARASVLSSSFRWEDVFHRLTRVYEAASGRNRREEED